MNGRIPARGDVITYGEHDQKAIILKVQIINDNRCSIALAGTEKIFLWTHWDFVPYSLFTAIHSASIAAGKDLGAALYETLTTLGHDFPPSKRSS